ncbi:MAG: hypothetical protein JRM80_08195 [Nitrososphaerota archaeon]|nr:hypothetical protein [Nitrososphaerota archaeon]
MRGEVVAVVAVVGILVGAGVGYLVGNAAEHAPSYVSTHTTTLVANPNLELIPIVSPHAIAEGQSITIGAEVFNPLPVQFRILLVGAPCGTLPTSYKVYMGDYTYSTLSSGTALLLHNVSIIPPCFRSYNSTLTFLPDSNLVHDSSIIGNFTHPVNYTDVLSGYWTPDGQLSDGRTNYAFQVFSPGIYTVLIEDAWGQQELEYFEVSGATASAVTPQGLRLSLALNSTELQPGEYVAVNASLSNTLSALNPVNSTNRWPVKGLSVSAGCASWEYPFGVAVFQGYYSARNISTGTYLAPSKPVAGGCPVAPTIQYYEFAPQSDAALAVLISTPSAPTFKVQMNTTITFDGYWTGYAIPSPGFPAMTFHEFGSGTYTVMTGDEWGNLVLLYFSVA